MTTATPTPPPPLPKSSSPSVRPDATGRDQHTLLARLVMSIDGNEQMPREQKGNRRHPREEQWVER